MRVRKSKCIFYKIKDRFEITMIPDHYSGRKHRYTAVVLTSDGPLIVGREIPKSSGKQICRGMALAWPSPWFGDMATAVKAYNNYLKRKKAEVNVFRH